MTSPEDRVVRSTPFGDRYSMSFESFYAKLMG